MTETETKWGSGLLDQHRRMLESSAITPEVAQARGYRSVTEKATLERAKFSPAQRRVPGLLIPMFSVSGECAGYQYRPDSPRQIKGKAIKYETRSGQHAVIDVPPKVTAMMTNPEVALWITEGSKKADSAVTAGLCCIALTGVWNWRGTNVAGGKAALPDWEGIALNGRPVVLAFDSDSTEKVSVYDALVRLAGFLESRGAIVYYLHLPDADDGSKVGLDDYIATIEPGTVRAALEPLTDRTIGPRPHVPVDLPVGADGLNMTDSGNAERLIAAHGDQLRFVSSWGQWIAWDRTVWKSDPGDVRAIELGKSISRGLWEHVATMSADKARDSHIRFAKSSESYNSIVSAVRLARGLPGVAISHDELDADPWLLNAVNGTIDLRTGTLHPHDPEQLHSRIAGTWFDPDATAPRWEKFLATILPDPEIRTYVQRAIGYTLTGLTTEQVMFLAIGNGSNGKSTLIDAVKRAMGDYAGPVAKDLIVAQRHEAHPTSVADLFRLRFAIAMETEATNTLAEARVKALTGSDPVLARRMGQDFWHFEPTHKMWLAANYLPKISGTDNGIWRRMRVVPFTVEIGDDMRDPNLPAALADELPGILRWAVDGCLAWQSEGLNTPAAVEAATAKYRGESDWFVQFTDEAGWVIGNGHSTTVKEINNSLSDWARTNGEVLNRNMLAKELTARGCRQSRTGSTRAWVGIGKADFL
jgi:putative DNA primase/helicase